jgi:hypothetical protein
MCYVVRNPLISAQVYERERHEFLAMLHFIARHFLSASRPVVGPSLV